jgi:hypothetical protein
LGLAKTEIFLQRGWTAKSLKRPSGKSVERAGSRIAPLCSEFAEESLTPTLSPQRGEEGEMIDRNCAQPELIPL